MKVRELVKALEQIQDQDAPVLIGEGLRPDIWLVVTGIVERGIERRDALDAVGPGHEIGIEIVQYAMSVELLSSRDVNVACWHV